MAWNMRSALLVLVLCSAVRSDAGKTSRMHGCHRPRAATVPSDAVPLGKIMGSFSCPLSARTYLPMHSSKRPSSMAPTLTSTAGMDYSNFFYLLTDQGDAECVQQRVDELSNGQCVE